MTDLQVLTDYVRKESGYEGAIDPDLDLLDRQILDSFSIVQWALFVQEHFGVEFEAEDLVRENLASLSRVMALVNSKRTAQMNEAATSS